jgi:hypothetical protein
MAKFVDRGVSRGQRGGTPTAVNLFSRSEPLLFFQVAPHLSSQGLSRPRSRHWFCSQEVSPLEHRHRQIMILYNKLPINIRGGGALRQKDDLISLLTKIVRDIQRDGQMRSDIQTDS